MGKSHLAWLPSMEKGPSERRRNYSRRFLPSTFWIRSISENFNWAARELEEPNSSLFSADSTSGGLIPHFGGYHCGRGPALGLNFCLILVRPELPWTSGCNTRAYLPTSQNRFWQSISCSRRPRSPSKCRPRRAKVSSPGSANKRRNYASIPAANPPQHLQTLLMQRKLPMHRTCRIWNSRAKQTV